MASDCCQVLAVYVAGGITSECHLVPSDACLMASDSFRLLAVYVAGEAIVSDWDGAISHRPLCVLSRRRRAANDATTRCNLP